MPSNCSRVGIDQEKPTVRNNGFNGINVDDASLVTNCIAADNGQSGFELDSGSALYDSIARGNTGWALAATSRAIYRGNVFTANNSGNEQQVLGGTNLGSNYCGSNTVCP